MTDGAWLETDDVERPGQPPHFVVEKCWVRTLQGIFHAGLPTHFHMGGRDNDLVLCRFKLVERLDARGQYPHAPTDLRVWGIYAEPWGRMEMVLMHEVPIERVQAQVRQERIGSRREVRLVAAPNPSVVGHLEVCFAGDLLDEFAVWLDEVAALTPSTALSEG